MRDLDLSYNLISTHDRDGVYVLVDHDEEDVVAANAPINNIYTPGAGLQARICCMLARAGNVLLQSPQYPLEP